MVFADEETADAPWHRLFTVPYFSVRLSRSSALHYGQPSWMSVKTTLGAGGGFHFLLNCPPPAE